MLPWYAFQECVIVYNVETGHRCARGKADLLPFVPKCLKLEQLCCARAARNINTGLGASRRVSWDIDIWRAPLWPPCRCVAPHGWMRN